MLVTEKWVRMHLSRIGQGRGRKKRHIRSDGSCFLHALYSNEVRKIPVENMRMDTCRFRRVETLFDRAKFWRTIIAFYEVAH
jgi:hypothetical protein